jgi:adenylate cyclase
MERKLSGFILVFEVRPGLTNQRSARAVERPIRACLGGVGWNCLTSRAPTANLDRVSVRFQRRLAALCLIGLCSAAAGCVLYCLGAVRDADNVLYDIFYRHRSREVQSDGPAVIVAADDYSLGRLLSEKKLGWPWPRDEWAAIIQYAASHGARAVVIDLLFSEPSVFERDMGDDDALADAIDSAGIPVVLATNVAGGVPVRFAIPVKSTVNFGAVNQQADAVIRRFNPTVQGYPSLAARATELLGVRPASQPFLLRYYGPHVDAEDRKTFRYVSAADVVDAWLKDAAAIRRVGEETFKNKVVLIGAIAAGTYDVKATPLSSIYPGVEIQATAIENMLQHQQVRIASAGTVGTIICFAAMCAALGAGIPRAVWKKMLLGLASAFAPLGASSALFRRNDILWLPPTAMMVAGLVAMTGVLCWSYFVEDREHRFFLRALSQYVSPAVATELSRNPSLLRLGNERREMTVLFSDIAGFTNLSEDLSPDRLGDLLNFYLGRMSEIVLKQDGTLDKYIGDSIMAFWNAPLTQPDHARRACQVAMAMRQCEDEIAAEIAGRGGGGMHTRIGVHTGPMAVGNLGSLEKFNYSVIGDAVNVGSRLEGANKLYGTRILLSDATVACVADHVLVRKIDVLRLRGRLAPVSVYEPLAEHGRATPGQIELVSRYEAASSHCRAMRWDLAEEQFNSLLAKYPDDPPAKVMLKRIAAFRKMRLTEWDGVFVDGEK